MSRPRYDQGKPSEYIEITHTRKGTWRVEAPCGWWSDFGTGLDLAIARSLAYAHRNRCWKCVKTRVGYEVGDEQVAS